MPIGKLKIQITGDPNPLYGTCPIYGARDRYLPLANRTAFQVLINYIGAPLWINVDRSDVTLD